MDQCISELVLSLNVTELKINVSGLDYIELGGRLEPSKDVIAINSNFTHKAFEGYEQFLTKSKGTKRCRRSTPDNPLRRRKRAGDGSTFNACIEFMIIVDEFENTKVIRYFPRSGSIQVFGSLEPVDIFLHYLTKCSLPEFSSVELEGGSKPLLLNYRFAVNIGDNKFIDLTSLAHILESNNDIREKLPFPIKYIKHDAGDVHSKIAIVFTSKIRVHIWPKSGKVNMFGFKTELSAVMVYDFIHDIFRTMWNDLVRDSPYLDVKNNFEEN